VLNSKFSSVNHSSKGVMVSYCGDQYFRSGFSYSGAEIRTKSTHPYNYDPIMQFLADEVDSANASTVYTDRLMQFDYQKTNRLMQKHFGNTGHDWNDRAPEKIEAFLRDWNEAPDLKLIAVIEYCNQASGFPVWRLDYSRD
jgi:hypothetical protein